MKRGRWVRDVVVLGWLLSFGSVASGANTYHASPAGGGDGKSESSPFRVADFWGVAAPGDTLLLADGTYTGDESVIRPKHGLAGTAAAPIRIKALHDGKALIDGEHRRIPIYFYDNSHFVVEGLRAARSSRSVVQCSKSSHHLTFKRVSASDALCTAEQNNNHIFLISASDCLLEDCAAFGKGRLLYYFGGDRNTARRCWGRWEYSWPTRGASGTGLTTYGADDSLVENCVMTRSPAATQGCQGLNTWAHTFNHSADRNRFLGNIVHDIPTWGIFIHSAQHRIEGTVHENNVVIDCAMGIKNIGDARYTARNNTVVNVTARPGTAFLSGTDNDPKDPDFKINTEVRNTILYRGDAGFVVGNTRADVMGYFRNQHNNVFGFARPYVGCVHGTGDAAVDPGFKTAVYGRGAYLFLPADSPLKRAGEEGQPMGATVLYRYQDGVLTQTPLWPWPMEDRILAETGVSVTWEAKGGLWKTLNGVYPEAAPVPAAPVPTAPAAKDRRLGG